MALAANIVDGRGLSNKMYYEYLPKRDQDDAVFAVYFITGGIPRPKQKW